MDFQLATGKTVKGSSSTSPTSTSSKTEETIAGGFKKEEPPDVEQIGASSWTLLHSIAATYPEQPTNTQQSELKQFMKLFGKFYPCWHCAEDYNQYIEKSEPIVESQEKFGKWLCDAHNDVNIKLGKPKFDCNLWQQRWKDGWEGNKPN